MLLNLTTRRVLVMEWVVGERLRSASEGAEAMGVRGSAQDLALVDVGVRCSLEQMLEEGFYHAGMCVHCIGGVLELHEIHVQPCM